MSLEVTQEKIQRLLQELRSWEPGEHRCTLHELQAKFDLPIYVVGQVARSEGLELRPGLRVLLGDDGAAERQIDPDASTLDLDPVEIKRAVDTPEADPAYPDRDSGVWRKKPTGEWELDVSREENDDD